MQALPGVTRLAADGAVGTSGAPIRVYWACLVSGGTGSTTSLKNGTGTGGTAYAQIDGTANEGVIVNFSGGMFFPDGCFMDTDANITYCTFGYSKEN